MSKLRFALVGCGSIARKHAHALHNYLEDAEIGAFVDRDVARAQEFSKKYGAPAFADIDEMMRSVGRPDRRLLGPHAVAARTARTCSSWRSTAVRLSSRSRWRSGSRTPIG